MLGQNGFQLSIFPSCIVSSPQNVLLLACWITLQLAHFTVRHACIHWMQALWSFCFWHPKNFFIYLNVHAHLIVMLGLNYVFFFFKCLATNTRSHFLSLDFHVGIYVMIWNLLKWFRVHVTINLLYVVLLKWGHLMWEENCLMDLFTAFLWRGWLSLWISFLLLFCFFL